jgi:AbrB family looped-hinge helix DNA binding protein
MSDLVQVRKKSQITLPKSIKEKLGIEEGDFIDFQVRENEVVFKVKKLVDKDEAWFWSKRWQEGEKAADEDIKSGRVYHFENMKDAIAFLDEQDKTAKKKSKKPIESKH